MTLEPDPSAKIPLTIDKILSHVVNYDEETKAWFLNWLAYIFTKRTKSRVAIVLHGTKGTGKGVFFDKVIKPLFGTDTCQGVQQNEILQDRFNEFLGRSLMIMLDESQSDESFRNKLFHWISEPSLRLRVAYAGGKMIQSFANFILASNQPDAAPIELDDRRFTVSPRQLVPLKRKYPGIDEEIQNNIAEELSEFARYLLAYKVDEYKATTPLENKAKADMREVARTSIDVFIEALMSGDFKFFVQMLNSNGGDLSMSADIAIKRWAKDVNQGHPTPVSIAELQSVYRLLSGSQIPVTKFSVMLLKRGVPKPKDLEVGGKVAPCVEVEWTASPLELSGYKDLIGTVRAAAVGDPSDRAVLSIGRVNT
jgi:hypothetical protein